MAQSTPTGAAGPKIMNPVAKEAAKPMGLLPKEPTKPKTEFNEFLTMLYGAPKVGKSTFCSQLDYPLFLDTENGLKSLETYRVELGDWETFTRTCMELRQEKGKLPFKTLVIDTVDNLFGFCRDHVRKKLGVMHESDLDYGKGWDAVKSEFAPAMNFLKTLGMGIVYVSHAQVGKIKTRTGEYDRWTPTLSKSASDVLMPALDFILFAEILAGDQGDVRVIHTKPCQHWIAGDKTGRMPADIPFTAAAFIEAYKQTLDKGAAK